MINKKGEITSAQIVMIVLAIAGFAIVIYLFFMLDLGSIGTRETCHLSVLRRATVPQIVQGYVPLTCTTDKICVTDGFFGGKCEKQFAGEKDITLVRLSGSPDEKRRKIEEISANAMYDCWSMMGEGKLDIFWTPSQEVGWSPTGSTCVICSRVAVDESVSESILYDIDEKRGVNVNRYIAENKVPGKEITYLQAFTDRGISAYSRFGNAADFAGTLPTNEYYKQLQESLKGSLSKEQRKATKEALALVEKELASTANNHELAFVFSQIKTKEIDSTTDILADIAGMGATAAGATFAMPVVGNIGTALYVGVLGVIAGSTSEIYGAWNAYESQITAMGYCGPFASTKKEAAQGCSVINAVNYDFKSINNICQKLEGNP